MSAIRAQWKRDHNTDFGCYIEMYERIRPDVDMLDLIAQGKPPWVGDSQRSQWIDYYGYFVKRLNKELETGKYKYLLIDTIEPVEAAMTAAVEAGKGTFGWSGNWAYGRMETEGVRPLYENLLEAVARRGVETILISSHIKQAWSDKEPIPGKVKPGGRMAVLARLSTAMFWLFMTTENEDGAPAAAVLKARMGKYEQVDNRWVPRRVLPQRIPHFSWQDVEGYKRNPANLATPRPGERLTESEQETVSELLTDVQMRLMVLGAETELAVKQRAAIGAGVPVSLQVAAQEMAGENPPVDPRARAVALMGEGWTVEGIAADLDMPPLLVKGWLE